MTDHERMRQIIYGVACGDALGIPFQFEPRSDRKRMPAIGMGQYRDALGRVQRVSDDSTGLWSDDTSLTLCLAASLAEGFDLTDQAERFVAWLDSGYLCAQDAAFDQGIQTVKSLDVLRRILRSGEFSRLEQLADDSNEDSNGNGALMRILPLALYIRGMDSDAQFKLTRKAAALTHPHIRSALCCWFYLKMAQALMDGRDKSAALRLARTETAALMERQGCPQREYNALERLLKIDLETLAEDEIDSSGYVVSTLEASLWCLLTTTSYQEAVLKAVNLGDDADTTGAVTGGLAALIYGFTGIPATWTGKLKKPELLDTVLKQYS